MHYSCATPPSQWYTLNPDYILMYAQLLIVKVATFVVVLWIFRFDVCLDCILLHHLFHPLLANISSYLFSHSLPMSLLISLSRHCFLLPRKQSLVLPQFHVGPEIYLVLVEYWLTHFYPFCCICNHCCCYLLLCHNFYCQTIINHNPILQSNQNRILHCFLDLQHVVQSCKCMHLFDYNWCDWHSGQNLTFYNFVGL